MSVALYMDVHVPKAVSRELRKLGVDVLTAQEDGTTTLDDELLLRRATSLGRVLVSQDVDLLEIASRYLREGRPFAGLVFAGQMTTPLGRMVQDLTLIGLAGEPSEVRDSISFLPL